MRLLLAVWLLHAQALQFEVATVKPYRPIPATERWYFGPMCHGIDNTPTDVIPTTPLGRCVLQEQSLRRLITLAYSPRRALGPPITVTGGPRWVDDDLWEVLGKADDPAATTLNQLIQMLQTLLSDRFKLRFHRQTEVAPGYRLVIGQRGAKLPLGDSDKLPGMAGSGAQATFRNVPLYYLIRYLSGRLATPIEDGTGLDGIYTFTVTAPPREVPPDSNGAFIAAVEEQLGLRLVPKSISVETIVIDSAEKPSDQ